MSGRSSLRSQLLFTLIDDSLKPCAWHQPTMQIGNQPWLIRAELITIGTEGPIR